MDKIDLQVNTREILGKKVKNLRRQGIVPVHLFGHGIDSQSLEGNAAKLEHSLARAGESRLINLTVNNETAARPVVVREIQRDALKGGLLHVDFYQVEMAEKMKVKVPIILIGESPALSEKENTIVQTLDELSIECLPANIPDHIEVDISSLTSHEHSIRIKDVDVSPDIAVLNDEEDVVVTIVHRAEERVEEVEEEVTAPSAEEAVAEEKSEAEQE